MTTTAPAPDSYEAMDEHRQEWHRALIRSAIAYAMCALPPGPLMDHVCADLEATDRYTPRMLEDLARDVLRLPLPQPDPPRRPEQPPGPGRLPSWDARDLIAAGVIDPPEATS